MRGPLQSNLAINLPKTMQVCVFAIKFPYWFYSNEHVPRADSNSARGLFFSFALNAEAFSSSWCDAHADPFTTAWSDPLATLNPHVVSLYGFQRKNANDKEN